MCVSSKEPSQVSRNAGPGVELAPGDPHDSPTLGEEQAVAFAIRLERPPCPVRRAPIQLDDESRLRPEAVDYEESTASHEIGVEAWARKSMSIDEPGEALLEVIPRDAGSLKARSTSRLEATAARSRIVRGTVVTGMPSTSVISSGGKREQ